MTPEEDINDFVANSSEHNLKLIRRTKPSTDQHLDREAWRKSLEEVDLGLLSGPVYSLHELEMKHPCLVRRHGLWEQHGNGKTPSA